MNQAHHDLLVFIVNTWLWHLSWGWMQVKCNLIIMFLLLRVYAGINWSQSALLALMSHFSVSLLVSAYILMIPYISRELVERLTLIGTDKYMLVCRMTVPFGLLYGFYLSIFFTLFTCVHPLPLARMYCVVMLSALLSALITPFLIRFYI